MSSRIAVIGAGMIGLSFARLFARSGHDVTIADPRDDLAEALITLRRDIENDIASGAARDTITTAGSVDIADTIAEAVAGAVFVQESGPENPETKPALFAQIAEGAPADAVFATSSSTIPASLIATELPDHVAGRILVGHPFNPPHLMPLIELVPSPRTSRTSIDTALEIYRGCGREPVVLQKEVRGFVGNRLQNALLKEAIALVQNGVIEAHDLDTLMVNSLGLRWSAVGQFAGMHHGGGNAGIRGFMHHIGPAFAAIDDLPVDLGEEAMEQVYEQVEAAYGRTPRLEDATARDRIQEAVLRARSQLN